MLALNQLYTYNANLHSTADTVVDMAVKRIGIAIENAGLYTLTPYIKVDAIDEHGLVQAVAVSESIGRTLIAHGWRAV